MKTNQRAKNFCRKGITALLIAAAAAFPATAQAASGVIALIDDNKIVLYMDDYTYMGATIMDVRLYEDRGDRIYGVDVAYGGQTWYDREQDRELSVFVDEYWMSAEDAMRYFSE